MSVTTLREVPTFEALEDLYAKVAHDDSARSLVLGEIERRERLERQQQARAAEREEWEAMAWAQYEAADRECCGYLIRDERARTHDYRETPERPGRCRDCGGASRHPWHTGVSAFILWTRSEDWARKYASEELCSFWDTHPRVTVTEYRDQITQGKRIQRDERDAEATDSTKGEDMTGDTAPRAPEPAAADTTAAGRIAAYQAAGRQRRDDLIAQARGQVAVRDGSAIARSRGFVDGAETLEYARKFLGHLVIWPSPEALTVAALWAMHTHCRDASGMLVFLSSPRLLFSSAEPGSGKSEAMKAVSRLCPSPVVMTEPSEPAVAHSVGAHESIFLDEADVLFGKGTRKAAIRAIINDGYTPDGVWARVRNGSVHRLCTFGPLALAGLDKIEHGTEGAMAATLSRAWRMRMRRAPDDWRAPRYDGQARYAAKVISERMSAWAAQNIGELATHVPEMPEGIGNRPAQLAEPLLIVADVAGGDWPQVARDAIEEMVATGGQSADDEEKTERLNDIMAGWDLAGEEE